MFMKITHPKEHPRDVSAVYMVVSRARAHLSSFLRATPDDVQILILASARIVCNIVYVQVRDRIHREMVKYWCLV
jgi:hypothetical protein